MKNRDEAREWFKKAEEDLVLAERSLEGRKKVKWGACFHAQQSAEKDLKAFLVYSGIAPQKTHDLLELLKQCLSIQGSFTLIQSLCELLNPYSVQTRYPDALDISFADAKKAIRAAIEIKKFVHDEVYQ